jgi:hypothetical protein
MYTACTTPASGGVDVRWRRLTVLAIVRTMVTTSFRRTILSARWWHTWIGVFIGIVLTLWVVSGLVMLIPRSDVSKASQGTGRPIDWSAVAISPAEAIRAAALPADAVINNFELLRYRDGMAYCVRPRRLPPVLVDAATGLVITVSESLAVVLATEGIKDAKLSGVRRVESWGNGYHGPLPAYHVTFARPEGLEAYVMVATGEVRRTESWDRFHDTWGHGAHVFTPLNDLPGGERSRLASLWGTGVISLFSILTGYWLSLPRRWRARFS